MDLVFFIGRHDEATQVASVEDLPGDVAAEPLTIDGPEALLALGAALGVEGGPTVRRLRDATCQSFPVWAIAEPVCAALSALDDSQIDAHAKGWHTTPCADLHEKASFLAELRDAIRQREDGEELFALLEERAF